MANDFGQMKSVTATRTSTSPQGKLTPLMQQYWAVKAAHPDKIILFRMGDFFEMFHRDAEVAAPVLGIALTSRNKKAADETRMCGVPHFAAPGVINKLLKAGFKVAICDQLEDPKFAKGIVKRGVTRVLSPGMVYDPETLDATKAHYLASWDDDGVLAFLDVSTGEGFFFRGVDEVKRTEFLSSLGAVEWIVPAMEETAAAAMKSRAEKLGVVLSIQESMLWRAASGEEVETDRRKALAVSAAVERLLAYAIGQFAFAAAKSWIEGLAPFEARQLEGRMVLTGSTMRHLEVFETYKGEKPGSLVYAIDRTKSSGGARLLRQWLQFPLVSKADIEARQKQVAEWLNKPIERRELRKALQGVGDLPRRLGKISQPSRGPRDLTMLADSLEAGTAAMLLAEGKSANRTETKTATSAANRVSSRIRKVLVAEPPIHIRTGGAIQRGVNPTLDELMILATDSGRLLLELEAREREATGISSLKVRYNNVFGYSIEITNTHRDRVPKDRYERKQTLANAERYTTPELSELERKVLVAEESRQKLEEEEFENLVRFVLSESAALMRFGHELSEVDVVTALAELAEEQRYIRPDFHNDVEISIAGSRHPVVEQMLSQPFIENDIELKPAGCLLLTGPNMAGKSTLMRQVAVTSILAQMGSFVPAKSARLPLLERVSTRIGASDFLAEGLSTFMVEMKETAEILESASERTLVVLDEIGRGTATYDGLSLAQAILEYLLTQKRCLTLFATHYHELTKLAENHPRLQNAHMAIHEKDGVITFLHRLMAGAVGESYGIHVARLAGLPVSVTDRAQVILGEIEGGAEKPAPVIPAKRGGGQDKQGPQMSLVDRWLAGEAISESIAPKAPKADPKYDRVFEEIRSFDVNRSTPLEALGKISKWVQELQ